VPYEVRMSWSFEPRSGVIYVAQCVSIGKMDRIFKSRGAAVSRQESLNACGEVSESVLSGPHQDVCVEKKTHRRRICGSFRVEPGRGVNEIAFNRSRFCHATKNSLLRRLWRWRHDYGHRFPKTRYSHRTSRPAHVNLEIEMPLNGTSLHWSMTMVILIH
jgi:hypothetical protein